MRKTRVPRECQRDGCSTVFEVPLSKLKEGKGRYCSRECYGLARPKPAARQTCEVCGDAFYAPPRMRRKGYGRYCSRKCSGAARSAAARDRVTRRITNWDGDSDCCWEWTGALNRDGYGHTTLQGKLWRIHRYVYHLAVGPIPAGLCVLHRCDNPPCCNPAHLFLGTHADNVADKMSKGRHRGAKPGSQHHHTKLTEEDVLEIRRRLDQGDAYEALAVEFGVTPTTISNIRTRHTWRHI